MGDMVALKAAAAARQQERGHASSRHCAAEMQKSDPSGTNSLLFHSLFDSCFSHLLHPGCNYIYGTFRIQVTG